MAVQTIPRGGTDGWPAKRQSAQASGVISPRREERPPGNLGGSARDRVATGRGAGTRVRARRVGSRYPLRDIGLGLASHGIATLRYDKRTFVEQLQPRETTIERVVVDDAVSALDRLRAEGVSPCGVVGHSLGGMLAPRIASEDGNTDEGTDQPGPAIAHRPRPVILSPWRTVV
ncbi:hypothetical protein GCM10009030_20260 [Haloarcula pellucida]|uniref:Alpha/beta fold hydrolase n=1 Tax=Haloarcula pellucida TaxID=1427151 RepID=A0A830GKT7_9EURY|nr:hypothetical protein GCM10009030_20260 [Halomicroarcula pellucida]